MSFNLSSCLGVGVGVGVGVGMGVGVDMLPAVAGTHHARQVAYDKEIVLYQIKL